MIGAILDFFKERLHKRSHKKEDETQHTIINNKSNTYLSLNQLKERWNGKSIDGILLTKHVIYDIVLRDRFTLYENMGFKFVNGKKVIVLSIYIKLYGFVMGIEPNNILIALSEIETFEQNNWGQVINSNMSYFQENDEIEIIGISDKTHKGVDNKQDDIDMRTETSYKILLATLLNYVNKYPPANQEGGLNGVAKRLADEANISLGCAITPKTVLKCLQGLPEAVSKKPIK